MWKSNSGGETFATRQTPRLCVVACVVIAMTIGCVVVPSTEANAKPLSDINDCGAEARATLRERIFQTQSTLRAVILSRDVVHYEQCGWETKLAPSRRLLSRLASGYVTELREVAVTSQTPFAEAARDACEGMRLCAVEIYRRKDHTLPAGLIPFAKSGGLPFARFLGHTGDAGHFEITRAAIASMELAGDGWSRAAAEILQSASRDPDFFDWETPAAHAQTANDPTTARLAETDEQAQVNFVRWVAGWLKRSRDACIAGRHYDAIYFLGYALHGVQDLVFHEGISNAEHSYRDFKLNEGVDANSDSVAYADKMLQARIASVRLLQWFAVSGLPQQNACWKSMRSVSSAPSISSEQKAKLLGKAGLDFGVLAYARYRDLASVVEDASLATRKLDGDYFVSRRWLDNRQPERLDGFVERIAKAFHE